VVLPFPSARNVYAGTRDVCDQCDEPKRDHVWVCGGCGKELARGDAPSVGLHGYRQHPFARHHTSAAFLLCPREVARRAREGVWDPSTFPDPEVYERAYSGRRARDEDEDEERTPRPNGLPRNVENAWVLFGSPEKRTKQSAQKKYRDLAKKFHPDVNASKDASTRLRIANAAWEVLRDHYGW
jgi:hypothetical protein